MNKTQRGMSKIFLLMIILLVIIFSAIIFGYGGENVQDVKKEMQNKAQNAIDKKGDNVVDKVIDGGQEVIGRKLKETGEKILEENIKPGFYGAYGDNEINNYKKVVLFFTADWCPSCVNVDKSINKYKKQIPSDVAIVKVNFDKNEDLRKKYNITKQHTFVLVDNEGNEISRWNNSKTLQEIINNIK